MTIPKCNRNATERSLLTYRLKKFMLHSGDRCAAYYLCGAPQKSGIGPGSNVLQNCGSKFVWVAIVTDTSFDD